MRSASSTSPLPRHVTSRLVFASEPSFMSPGERRVHFTDHPLSLHLKQRRSALIEPELTCDPVPKPHLRRCFVCGTVGMHPLDFRVCPHTTVLLRRSLAKINEHGRLVSIDGSPLPMTHHLGSIAAHIISHARSSRLLVTEPSESSSTPRTACIPPHPVSVEPRDHVPSPSHNFNSRSPHAIPPIDRAEPKPEHVPLTQILPPHPSLLFGCTRATILLVLLEFMLDSVFRMQLCAILILLDHLSTEDPSSLQQHIQPVFMWISHLSFT
ncbi:hypothetical protein DFH08DRAFT_977256 [Mycena albidolilacea]|uniref:Uncharacterized protein n=1 Tax=Mycena albidolilacea TaxID=1033008 RepID=A0AAD6Z165_9AGAR|nr:hypothetical protein DFH08DRAFT_977256 [Mycena albidolilacea]